MSGYKDPAVTGRPCQRFSCGHGEGLHDDEGCTFCTCGYFLDRPLMEHMDALNTWRNVQGYNRGDAVLYGFLRVFEGYTHERAVALVQGRTPRKPFRSRKYRRAALALEARP